MLARYQSAGTSGRNPIGPSASFGTSYLRWVTRLPNALVIQEPPLITFVKPASLPSGSLALTASPSTSGGFGPIQSPCPDGSATHNPHLPDNTWRSRYIHSLSDSSFSVAPTVALTSSQMVRVFASAKPNLAFGARRVARISCARCTVRAC